MIYLWEIPENYKNREVGEYDRDSSPDNYWLTKGHLLTEFSPIPTVHFDVPQKNILKFDCLPNNSLVPLVNEKIRDILKELAPNDVQFFSAKLKCSDGELDGYSFLNSTHLITGIDHEKSICKKMDDYDGTQYIVGFHYLTYLKNCMGEYKLARDQEYRGNLLVNEKVKLVFDKEKITGVYLVNPEEHYRPITPEDLINDSLSNDID
jgi:hypothetical protein